MCLMCKVMTSWYCILGFFWWDMKGFSLQGMYCHSTQNQIMWMAEQFVLQMATPAGVMRCGWNLFGVSVVKNFRMFGTLLVIFLNKGI